MKKIIALLLVMVFAASFLVGCAPKATDTTPSPSPSESTMPSEEPSTVKTGLAIINSIVKSKDAGEEDGVAQADSVIVGVTVDADGKVVDCVIDMAQSKANFNAMGEVVTALDAEFMTKDELGSEYGLGAVSEIGKEWNEQTEALAQYVIGKTAEEITGIAVDDSGYATDADLMASVTVSIGGYVATIVKAIDNAMDFGATATDTVSLGAVTNIDKSKDVADDADGLIQIYSTYTAVTMDASGMITSCVIDASQSNVDFDAAGMITTDLTVAPVTKNELGDDYGLKNASGIGKEWNEQAAAFAAYVVGKTAEEVTGIAVDDSGHTTDADLMASVTVGIDEFQEIIEKAAA